MSAWRKSSYSDTQGNACVEVSLPKWRKSSRSNDPDRALCVEVASLGTNVGVRDTKNREGGHLSFTDSEWQTLINRIKSGKYSL